MVTRIRRFVIVFVLERFGFGVIGIDPDFGFG